MSCRWSEKLIFQLTYRFASEYSLVPLLCGEKLAVESRSFPDSINESMNKCTWMKKYQKKCCSYHSYQNGWAMSYEHTHTWKTRRRPRELNWNEKFKTQEWKKSMINLIRGEEFWGEPRGRAKLIQCPNGVNISFGCFDEYPGTCFDDLLNWERRIFPGWGVDWTNWNPI